MTIRCNKCNYENAEWRDHCVICGLKLIKWPPEIILCPNCNGSGVQHETQTKCYQCNGKGIIK